MDPRHARRRAIRGASSGSPTARTRGRSSSRCPSRIPRRPARGDPRDPRRGQGPPAPAVGVLRRAGRAPASTCASRTSASSAPWMLCAMSPLSLWDLQVAARGPGNRARLALLRELCEQKRSDLEPCCASTTPREPIRRAARGRRRPRRGSCAEPAPSPLRVADGFPRDEDREGLAGLRPRRARVRDRGGRRRGRDVRHARATGRPPAPSSSAGASSRAARGRGVGTAAVTAAPRRRPAPAPRRDARRATPSGWPTGRAARGQRGLRGDPAAARLRRRTPAPDAPGYRALAARPLSGAPPLRARSATAEVIAAGVPERRRMVARRARRRPRGRATTARERRDRRGLGASGHDERGRRLRWPAPARRPCRRASRRRRGPRR